MIIALAGFKGSGKSTAAKYLEDNYGFVRVNFKGGLIKELEQNFPDLLSYFLHLYGATDTDQLFDEKPEGVRALMMNYGTEVRRGDDEDYWVLQWKLAVADEMMKGNKNIVVDDLRFLSELRVVEAWRGKTVRINRDDVKQTGNHSSETELLFTETDFTISTIPGDLDHLNDSLDKIMDVLEIPLCEDFRI